MTLEWFENNPLNWLNCRKFVCRNVTVIIQIDLHFNVGLKSCEGLKRDLSVRTLRRRARRARRRMAWPGEDMMTTGQS